MAGENSAETVLEQILIPEKSSAYMEGFQAGMNHVSPLGFLVWDEPLPVMLADTERHFRGWCAGNIAGIAADGVLIYGLVRIVDVILDYI